MLCLTILAGITWLLRPFQWIGVFLAFALSVMLAYGASRVAAKKYRSIS
jgi:hypothetical protein